MNQKIGDLEFRWNENCDRNAEIVRWQDSETLGKFCYTLAWWVKDNEGYDLHFIGSRPLNDEVDKDCFWELVIYGQKICDAKFKVDEYLKDNARNF